MLQKNGGAIVTWIGRAWRDQRRQGILMATDVIVVDLLSQERTGTVIDADEDQDHDHGQNRQGSPEGAKPDTAFALRDDGTRTPDRRSGSTRDNDALEVKTVQFHLDKESRVGMKCNETLSTLKTDGKDAHRLTLWRRLLAHFLLPHLPK